MVYYDYGKSKHTKGGLPSSEGQTLQTKERRAIVMYISYADFIQTGLFIIGLIGLCYTIFKDKK